MRLWLEIPDGATHPIPPGRRNRFFRTQTWPFRPVLALRPTARGWRTVLAVPVEAARGDRLRTAIGVNVSRWWLDPESWVSFTIRAVAGGERKTLYSRTLDPHREWKDRGWFEVELSLDAFAGVPLELEFTTECQNVHGQLFEMGGWEIPRLVVAGQ